MSQTSYAANMTAARKGQQGDCGWNDIHSKVAEGGAMTFGLICEAGTACDQVKPVAALPAADTDSIATALASAATAQTFELTDLDGVIGDGPIPLAQRLAFVWNNHADWIAGWLKVVGEGPGGVHQVELVPVPVGGNTTTYSASVFKRVDRMYLDAMGGVNGTLDVGTDPTECILDPEQYPGVVLYEVGREPYAAATEVAQYTPVSILKRGRVWMQVEAAVTKGDPVFVRMLAAGADLRGQVRGTPAANFFIYHNARFVTTQSAADGLALVEFGG